MGIISWKLLPQNPRDMAGKDRGTVRVDRVRRHNDWRCHEYFPKKRSDGCQMRGLGRKCGEERTQDGGRSWGGERSQDAGQNPCAVRDENPVPPQGLRAERPGSRRCRAFATSLSASKKRSYPWLPVRRFVFLASRSWVREDGPSGARSGWPIFWPSDGIKRRVERLIELSVSTGAKRNKAITC
jgi:hypothetical protein